MAARKETSLLYRDLELVASSGTVSGLSDAELLSRFNKCRVSRSMTAGARANAEAAFEAIVAKHGPMVLSVCRSLLRHSGDADDAFQATFFVLVKKSASVRVQQDSLAPWLYGVARKVANKTRGAAWRRRRRESSEVDIDNESLSASSFDTDNLDLLPILHEELDRLPSKYRSPLVLCHLEGMSHEAAAQELQWPVGTVSGRLSRARDLLRTRLTRRGLGNSPAFGAGTGWMAGGLSRTTVVVPATLIRSTTLGALKYAAGETVPLVLFSLSQGVLTAMLISKLKIATLGLAGILVCGGTAGYVSGRFGSPTAQAEPPANSASDPKPKVNPNPKPQPQPAPQPNPAPRFGAASPEGFGAASDPQAKAAGGGPAGGFGPGVMMGMGGKANDPEPPVDIPGFPEYSKRANEQRSGQGSMGAMMGMMGGRGGMAGNAGRGGGGGGEGGMMGMMAAMGGGRGVGNGMGGGNVQGPYNGQRYGNAGQLSPFYGKTGLAAEPLPQSQLQFAANQETITIVPKGGRSVITMSITDNEWLEYQAPHGTYVLPLTHFNAPSQTWLAFGGDKVSEIAVFSGGKWVKHPLETPVKGEFFPNLLSDVNYYEIDGKLIAFSSETQTWGALPLTVKGDERPRITCSQTALIVEQGKTVNVFSVAKGKWSPTLKVEENEPQPAK